MTWTLYHVSTEDAYFDHHQSTQQQERRKGVHTDFHLDEGVGEEASPPNNSASSLVFILNLYTRTNNMKVCTLLLYVSVLHITHCLVFRLCYTMPLHSIYMPPWISLLQTFQLVIFPLRWFSFALLNHALLNQYSFDCCLFSFKKVLQLNLQGVLLTKISRECLMYYSRCA